MLRKYSTRSDSKKFCQICGRNGHEDEACAASPVTFTWKNGGNNVFLYGSWNQWQVKKPLMKDATTGTWKIQVSLAPGSYQYKFLVDDQWATDRDVPTVKDKYDKSNNVIEVLPAEFTHGESDPDDEELEKEDYLILVDNNPSQDPVEHQERKKLFRVKKITYELPAVWVSIKGSWDDWKGEIPLKRYRNNFTGMTEFYVSLKLLPGTYECKFLVDSEWLVSPTLPKIKTSRDNENNVLLVADTCPITKPHDKICLNWRREDGKWNDCGTIHHTLQGHTMNRICDKVYIFGGLANGKFTNALYTYDIKTGEFDHIDEQNGDIPDPRAFHSSMVFGTKILIYGGFNEEYLTDYYSFNTLNSVWTQAEIDGCGPGPRERCSLVPYVEDKVVLFGGYYCTPDMEVQEYFNDLYVLNLSLMEWIKPELEGDLPRPRSAHTANFVHGKMFMFGGVTKNQKNLNDIWVLKATPTCPLHWKKIEPKGNLPEPRHGHSSVVVENNIIFFGGRGNGVKRPFDDLIIFDTINEHWTYPKAGGIRPTPRYYHSAVALNEGKEIMIFGGVRPQEFLSYPRIYFLETKSNGQFEEIPEVPEKRGEEYVHRTD